MRSDDSIQLGKLEFQITDLIQSIENLRVENAALKRKILEHEHQQRQLQTKNIKTADRIKKIVGKLKEQIK